MSGKVIRMRRIFNPADNRACIIAIDHTQFMGPVGPLGNPEKAVAAVTSSGPDALLISAGMLRHGVKALPRNVGTVLRIDGNGTTLGDFEASGNALYRDVESALRLGADAVVIMLYVGFEREAELLKEAARVAEQCDRWGMPVMMEVWPKGPGIKRSDDPEAIRIGCRVASELGADIVKTFYTGSIESFREVTSGCPVPVVVLGGAQKDDVKQVFTLIHDALQAGASGVAMGRNVWGISNVTRMVQAVKGLIHEGWGVKQALTHLG
ncbi:MAG: fructose-bisphosphate aldolase [Deinococcus sp.]|nr:fructose-bisphosphate aldolase [Deinococcus sp.]